VYDVCIYVHVSRCILHLNITYPMIFEYMSMSASAYMNMTIRPIHRCLLFLCVCVCVCIRLLWEPRGTVLKYKHLILCTYSLTVYFRSCTHFHTLTHNTSFHLDTHSLIHSLIQSLIHSLIHSLISLCLVYVTLFGILLCYVICDDLQSWSDPCWIGPLWNEVQYIL